MTEGIGSTVDFFSWDEERLGQYFRSQGLGEYCDTLKKHKITGQLAPFLTDDDLKDMGITIVGDRLLFKRHLEVLIQHHRYRRRIQPIWQGEERLFFSNLDRACATAGGCCPFDPSTYTLTTSHLKVKRVVPYRCGPVPLCCFGVSYLQNNIDLSKVDDVDVTGVPPPCCQRICCNANGKDLVEIESRFERGGKITLHLEQGLGESVANMILNQVEESQKMERS